MRGKPIDPQIKAQVMAALLTGQGVTKIAEDFNLPHPTVSRIKSEIPKQQLDEVGRKNKKKLSDMTLAYTEALFDTLIEQTNHAKNKKYIESQSADGLAILHGVMSDKLFRLLQSFKSDVELGADDRDADPAGE